SGLAPFTMGERALERLSKRRAPVPSFYLDATLLAKYWDERQYHHTISAPLIYALNASLRLLQEEGLERRWRRHELNHAAFRAGIEALGLEFLPAEDISLWPLNAIKLPAGLDEAAIRSALLANHGIEVGGGLGPLKGSHKTCPYNWPGWWTTHIGVCEQGQAQDLPLRVLAFTTE